MKKNLLLYILLGFLILMNGFFLFKHFTAEDKAGPRGPFRSNFIAEQLEFNETQVQKFEELDSEHREHINNFILDIRDLKDTMFDKLSDETIDITEIDAIATQIAHIEKMKELEIFRFFTAVGELCDDGQKKRLKIIIKDALSRQGGPPGRNGPPPQNGRPGGPGDGDRPPPPRP